MANPQNNNWKIIERPVFCISGNASRAVLPPADAGAHDDKAGGACWLGSEWFCFPFSSVSFIYTSFSVDLKEKRLLLPVYLLHWPEGTTKWSRQVGVVDTLNQPLLVYAGEIAPRSPVPSRLKGRGKPRPPFYPAVHRQNWLSWLPA